IRAARLDLLELSERPFDPRRAQVLVNVHVVGPAGVLSPQGFPLADRVVEHLRSASGQDSYLLESPGNLPLLSPQRWLVVACRSLAAKRLPGVLSLVGSIFVFRGGRTGMSFQQGLVQIGTDNRLSANVRRGLRRRPRFRDATGMWSRGTAQRGPRWVITL